MLLHLLGLYFNLAIAPAAAVEAVAVKHAEASFVWDYSLRQAIAQVR